MNRPDLYAAGGVLVLTGTMLAVLADALDKAARVRATNGLPLTAGQLALTEALRQAIPEAVAARGHEDGRGGATLSRLPHVQPTLTVEQAAKRLRLSARQTRRLAPKLGGQIVNGHGWLLDELAVTEYAERRRS